MKEQAPCRPRQSKVVPKLDKELGQSLHRLAKPWPKVTDGEGAMAE